MKLLINEPPLQVLPSLANRVGLNEAILLQQLHFRSLISNNLRDGYKWVYKTYEEWKEDEFPFWSVSTIKRTISKLEQEGYLISTSDYNKMKMDKTKWYRIDYSMCYLPIGQNELMVGAERHEGGGQSDLRDGVKMVLPITKEIKSIKKENVEIALDAISDVINYLNEKAGKHFKSTTSGTQRFIKARIKDGYELDDFKRVIDVKTEQWLKDPHWNNYLRPSTLFSPTNFENYLNENQSPGATKSKQATTPTLQAPNLDFGKGEE